MNEKATEKTTPIVTALEKFTERTERKGRPIGVFESPQDFQFAQRIAKMLTVSNLMPEQFRGDQNLGSAVVIVDIAFRLKLNPLLVAQQIHIIYGKPGFSAQFAIGTMNSNADFGKLRYDLENLGEHEFEYTYRNEAKQKLTTKVKLVDWQCIAWALEGRDQRLPEGVNTLAKARDAGIPILEGPPVSIGMSVQEGWYGKEGSKWKTMPMLMLRYRAASFFGRIYAPELMMGLPTIEELQDLGPALPEFSKPIFGSPTPTIDAINPVIPPEPAPGAAEGGQVEKSAVTNPPPVKQTPVELLRDCLKIAKLQEQSLLEFLHEIGSIEDEKSLEEIHLKNPTLIPMLISQWSDIVDKMDHGKQS